MQIFVIVGVTGSLSLLGGQQAVNQVASELRSEITERIDQKLDEFFAIPHLINQLNLDAFRLGYLNLNDVDSLQEHFFRQMQSFESIGSIFFASETNEFIGFSRIEYPEIQLMRASPAFQGSIRFYEVDADRVRFDLILNLIEPVANNYHLFRTEIWQFRAN